MEQLNVASVLMTGLNFLERIHALLAKIWEVVTHGVRHGATSALAATHLWPSISDKGICGIVMAT
jgi:hypothetical protein